MLKFAPHTYAVFRADARAGVIAMKPLPEGTFAEARRLASRWAAKLGARSLDIMHVAAALGLRAEIFHTFDERQRKLAKATGLRAA